MTAFFKASVAASGGASVGDQTISGAAGTLTLGSSFNYIFVNTSSVPCSCALPAASNSGKTVIFKDISNNAATNNIVVAASTDGASTVTLNNSLESLAFTDNGSSWSLV